MECSAEKIENIKPYAGIRQDSCRIELGRDKIVWSVRFRRARRTIVRRAAKSGAEKAKTFNFMQESERIPTHQLQIWGTLKAH